MTEESFLRRWSRRKEAARDAGAPPGDPQEGRKEAPEAGAADLDAPVLPPIESLDSASDYTAFLKAGVPRALRHAALRKAWSSTPAIAGHKPLVDYDWDFHAPGYGRLWPIDDPARLVGALFAHLSARTHEAPAEEAPPSAGPAPEPDDLAARAEAGPPGGPTGPEPPDAEEERPGGTAGRFPDVPSS